ncbi:5-hydroxytryptamine receptor 1 [Fasciolopsis buskii]|uniref:5-hydroxytryptamine receptor 1 n=1 Tax=Fasciolopsis buskii TaxID=27845 RepID=A0A8E0VL74_9TREM|nr:5-hydroxytryptamine receptor 1 [Fasciolopsis buski]
MSCDVLCCTASILHLCLVALDRYMAIAYPLRYAVIVNTRRIRISMFLVWLTSAMISFIPIHMGWNEIVWYQPNITDNNEMTNNSYENLVNDSQRTRSSDLADCELKANIPYAIVSSCTSFYIPFCVFCILYGRILCIAHTQTLQVRQIRVRSFHTVRRFTQCDANREVRTVHSALVLSNRAAHPVPESDEETYNVNTHKTYPTTATKCECIGHKQISRDIFGRPCSASNESRGSRILYVLRPAFHRFSISSMKAEMKAIKTIGLLLGCFMICWLPFFLAYLIRAICQQYCRYPIWLMNMLTWVGYANSAANPVLYTFLQKDFRAAVCVMLKGQSQSRAINLRKSNLLPHPGSNVCDRPVHRRAASATELNLKLRSKTQSAMSSTNLLLDPPMILSSRR